MRSAIPVFVLLLWAGTAPAFQVNTDDKSKSTDQSGASIGRKDAATRRSIEGTIKGYATDGTELCLSVSGSTSSDGVSPGGIQVIAVQDLALKDGLKSKKWNPADRVIATIGVETKTNVPAFTLLDLTALPIPIGAAEPALAMLGAAVALLLFTLIVSRNIRGLLFIGQDGRYSNSKTQMSVWFGLVIATYVSAFWLRWIHAGFIGHISIPTNLMLLSGMSGLTFAGAKGITSQKIANADAAQAPGKQNGGASFPGDLIKADNGTFDLGDYQMIVITLIAAITYVIVACTFLAKLEQRFAVTLPDVDSTILALFGVGQGAYLTKKAVSDINH